METKSIKRRNEVVKMLTEEKELKTSTLANYFGVSTETIRKDLLILQEIGVIQKLHGKAHLLITGTDTPIDIRTYQRQTEKLLIAQKALEMIENNTLIYIDGGSTTLEIAKLLTQKEGLVVITTSLIAAGIIAKQKNTVYVASGFVEGSTMIITGPYIIESIKRFMPVISFMGTNGVRNHTGPTSKDYHDIDVKNEIVKNSTTSVVVCDSSKFHESGILQYANWGDIDYLITDSDIPAESKEDIEKSTRIIIA